MAPPNRSRRKRHSKSPRHKRFGSGKSTPSSPAGTPVRRSHSHSISEAGEGTSTESHCDTVIQVLSEESPSAATLNQSSVVSTSQPEDCSSKASNSNYECVKLQQDRINAELDTSKEIKTSSTMSSGKLNKLDRLCGLLENIVIEHNSSISQSGKSSSENTPINKTPNNEEKADTTLHPIKTDVSVSVKEKTREELELERKLRKEAKKAKKKGNNKENEQQNSANESKQVDDNIVLKSTQKTEKPCSANETQKSQDDAQKIKQHSDQKPDEGEATGKSKADLKRERREKQEAQRKAKAEAKAQLQAEKQQNQPQAIDKDKSAQQQPRKKTDTDSKRVREKRTADKDRGDRRIPLLDHLMAHVSQVPSHPVNSDFIHPAVRTLGIKMKERVIDGSTARVISMLAAFKRLISDYQTPESCDLSRDLAEKLVPNISFLSACRPQCIAMDNAVRFLKHEINHIKPEEPEAQAKDHLQTSIDEYIHNNIILASSTIASHSLQVIQNGDVILTFGYSALVSDVVEAACNRGNRVSVVVADTPHPASGAAMVKRLASLGVTTYYRFITEVSHIMNKVTKVVVEAEAVMMNGAVQGLCGTAGLALAAANHDTPFIVLCHTYKFCNNDLTDSLVINELGDADSMVSCPSNDFCNLLTSWRETPNLNVVSLVYDVTPASLVTALITEQNVLPTSAVPVIIRRNYADILGQD
ncbi:Eukaryotic translation initiation factor 2B, subunit 4 delta, 67kDa [Halocaridina rubra]|uniref:Translation initiation factor eIF2B subunit delta n=1 Tax=Halocaridina rubra TaxID=373956 RepID=A0AAN8ZZ98_HALRR